MEVGFIGLGVMGRAMAANLVRAGHRLTVYNRTREATGPLADLGAAVAQSPRQAAEGKDAVISIVTDDAAVSAVLFGEEGALLGARAGALVIDMSTVSPAIARQAAQQAAQRGLRFLDAPVTGGDVGAREGTLTIMVGGDEAAFSDAQPLFSVMGRRIVRVGGPGSGQTMKLAANLVSAMTLMVAAEGLQLGLRLGLPAEILGEVMPNSSAASYELAKLLDRHARQDWEPGFSVQNRLKDLRLAVEMAEQAGITLPMAPKALELYRQHAQEGAAPLDEASYLRRLLG